jgi:hypothetical protein
MSVRASPNDFGAQLGEAAEGAGKQGFDLALKQQGMVNETAMTDADAAFATKVGELKGKYTSLSGMSAYAAFPQYQEDIKKAFQETRANLPAGAQRGFDLMAARTMANHIADGSSYASSQLKEANRDAYSNMADVNVQALLDPAVASNPERSQYHLDSLKYAAQAQMDEDHPGLKKDPETGRVSFDENTQEGLEAKASYENKQNEYLTKGYVNRFETLAKINPTSAYSEYQKERESMPRSAQVALDASFAPKVFGVHVQLGSSTALAEASQAHADMLYNPGKAQAINVVLRNEGGLSPDGHAIYGIDKNAHPEEFARAKEITDKDGEVAGKLYAKQFYQKEFYDKKGIGDLPPQTQDIVMDGVVNHSTDFGNKLIQAAKNGSTPQELLDMRKTEYQRLATENPEKYGKYLQGWENRLTNMQSGLAMEGRSKPYGANPDGSPLTQADYFRTHSEEVLARGDAYAESKMPGDLALKRAVRQSLTNQMNKVISNEKAQYMLDNKSVMRAINGEMSNGKPPQTEEELRAIPGVADLLDRVAVQDPGFSQGIPTMLAKAAYRDSSNNSPNGYETILRSTQSDTNPDGTINHNGITSQDHLARLLGRTDGTGISMKDYNDAKPLIESSQTWKSFVSQNMKEIAMANGNIDGKGQERAVAWYNQVTKMKQRNEASGNKAMSEEDLIKELDEAQHGHKPGTMEQISNFAKDLLFGKPKDIPTFNSPEDPEFQKLPAGTQFKTADGQIRTKR